VCALSTAHGSRRRSRSASAFWLPEICRVLLTGRGRFCRGRGPILSGSPSLLMESNAPLAASGTGGRFLPSLWDPKGCAGAVGVQGAAGRGTGVRALAGPSAFEQTGIADARLGATHEPSRLRAHGSGLTMLNPKRTSSVGGYNPLLAPPPRGTVNVSNRFQASFAERTSQ